MYCVFVTAGMPFLVASLAFLALKRHILALIALAINKQQDIWLIMSMDIAVKLGGCCY